MNRGTRATLVTIACGALVGIPALARAQQQDPAGSFVARDLPDSGHFDANGDQSSSSLTVTAGSKVAFSYPATGTSHHTVVFNSDAKPACTGVPNGNPFITGNPGWSGTCTFDSPGTYTFVCGLHPDMTGKVTVTAAPTPTPTTPGATPTPTPVNPYPTPAPTATPLQTTLRGAVELAPRQRGTRVRGSVLAKAARSRLEVALSARLPGGHKPVRVGRWRRTATKAGRVRFVVPLSARARSVLRKRHRLRLTVTVALTPPRGHTLTRRLHTTLGH